ncbi:cellulose binding domain-containing protein [Kitasatospora sp. MAA4]|uniref:cellulose binding domain-containing protein n=1 Tax=Kitasatospora sp. MAA4 TaxID=3035093 RepID=UPI002476B3C8|nr:cellulose binding domain-containing protein [Kitasatospora sp. MAA4]
MLLLVTALAAAGIVAYPMLRSAHSAAAVTGATPAGPAELTVRYRTDPASTVAVAKPWVEVINASKKPVNLSDVTLRYYFSADDASAAYGSNCVQTHLGCANVTESIVTAGTASPNADHYVQIGFTSGAGNLAPGATTEAIGLQLYRLDHQQLNQSNDRSFDAKDTHYAPSKLVTAYIGSTLAWGEEPSGAAAPGQGASAPAAAQAAGAPPAGVFFDNFHYSGPDDPVLAANGWQARTEQGGPGIHDTWTPTGVSFPADTTAQGGQALQVQVSSDGTKQGTKQAELMSTKAGFFTGTIAARVYFSDTPANGPTGDHLNESFYAISPDDTSAKYSELDYEYMPNGGWGAPGPELDTTSWHSAKQGDRATKALKKQQLQGWHVMMITAMNGSVTYSMDGHDLFTSDSRYFPRESMNIHFNTWLIDLQQLGAPRTWDTKVNWLYYQANQTVSGADVQKAVTGLYAAGTNYVDTLPKS